MTTLDLARDAVGRFAGLLPSARRPDLLRVRVQGEDGMARLCAIESAIAELWPASTAKEMIWLTRTAATETLHLQAFTRDGELLGEATYGLERVDG
jgi:hypothetical protein